MRLLIAAVGRLKQGPERELAERYRKRAEQAGSRLGLREIEIVEIRESRADDAARRMLEESIALATMIPEKAAVLVLDPEGENLDSPAFAAQLKLWQEEARPATVCIIGGADGVASSLLERADLRVAFGKLTWPHQIVRILLLEQVYRAVTILSGHPYHRG
jgi:23S rRNA (pseudouridine1915-N3)-methyltransferase